MGNYRKEWHCCDSVSETQGYEPEECPFCANSAPASTVLTDERIAGLKRFDFEVEDGQKYTCGNPDGKWVKFSGVEALAAQAGQVAVPGWQLVPIVPTPEMIAAIHFKGDLDIAIGHAQFYKDAEEDYAAMLAAAPSPAKESK